jgi:DNA-binding transcriptional MerR regulator
MSEHLTNTPHATAAMLEITPVTLRRWCEYHAAHLSAGANPLSGKARRFNGRDIEVLRHVRSLRAQGLTATDINVQVAGLTFAVIESDEQSPSADTAIAPTSTAPDAAQASPAILVSLDAMQRQIDAIQQVTNEGKRIQRDTIYLISIGIMIGMLFTVGMIVLAWLYGGVP